MSYLDKDKPFRKSRFSIEWGGELGAGLEGWTQDKTWNGWEMPVFEAQEAHKLFKRTVVDINTFSYAYNGFTDTFTWQFDPSQDVENVTCELIETPEGTKKVYDFGSIGWCWDDSSDWNAEVDNINMAEVV